MHSLALLAFGNVGWEQLKPYIPLGLAFGGIYAVAGVGMVVLYRATGVLNLSFGAVGAAGALVSWWFIHHTGCPEVVAYLIAVAFGGVVTLLYGLVLGPAFAAREPLVKTMATLGLALVVIGLMGWRAPPLNAAPRFLQLPTTRWKYEISGATVNWTEIMALIVAVALTVGTTAYLRYTKLGTGMRALANDREISATLGVPVRRVEAAAWLGSGLVCGAAGLLLADQLQTLDGTTLAFTFVIASLSAAVIGRLSSLWVTLGAGIVIGLVQSLLTPFYSWPSLDTGSLSAYRTVTPFVIATVGLLWLARRRSITISRTTH
jgi:branched-chain amino acid transport system permease protein